MFSLQPPSIPVILFFCCWFLLGPDGCLEEVSGPEDDEAPTESEAPFYVGKYNGAVDVTGFETGESWSDRSATMRITFSAVKGLVDVSADVFGTDLQGGRIDIDVDDCSPGFSSLNCQEQSGRTLHSLEISFTGSTARAELFELKQTSDGSFVKTIEARGTLRKE